MRRGHRHAHCASATFATRTRPIGAGPRAFGALAFEGDGDLVLPSRIVARDADGRAWRTTIEGTDAPAPVARAVRTPDRVRGAVSASTSTNGAPRLEHGLAAIDAGEIEKVVLAREVDIEADAPFDVRRHPRHAARDAARLHRLRRPTVSSAPARSSSCGATGATSRRARWPVPATTRPRSSPRPRTRTSTGSSSTRSRRRCATGATRSAATGRPPSASRPSPTSRRRSAAGCADPDVRVTDLVELLHPTPAVGGWPAQPARTMIRTLEGHDRGRYAGPCGWVDTNGDGEFVVALRARSSTDRTPGSTRVRASSPARSPVRSGPRRRPSSQPMLRALVRP